MSLTVSSIPTDIWRKIGLEYSTINDLLQLQQACKSFYKLFRENCFWIPFYNQQVEKNKNRIDCLSANTIPRVRNFLERTFSHAKWPHGSVQQLWLKESLEWLNSKIKNVNEAIISIPHASQFYNISENLEVEKTQKQIEKVAEGCQELEKLKSQRGELEKLYNNFLLPLEKKVSNGQKQLDYIFCRSIADAIIDAIIIVRNRH